MAGRLDVRGGLERGGRSGLPTEPAAVADRAHHVAAERRQRPTPASRRNVHHHYDLGNDFYRSWLDDQMVYTCAYFEHPDVSLEEAQRAKLDLVCRKLRLQPGETVVEAGCGWGALALHMARAYGVRVKAFNVSREQIAYARDRAAREGLASQVEFIDDDYRNVAGEYDAFVSVGMLEHVGLKHFGSLAERADARAAARARPRTAPFHRPRHSAPAERVGRAAHLSRRLPTDARRSGDQGARAGADVDRGRREPAAALCDARWRTGARRFARDRATQVRARYGETFRRAWELYLAGSEAAFAVGTLQLFQVVFSPLETAPPYWTRAEMYGRARSPATRAEPLTHWSVADAADALIVGGGPSGIDLRARPSAGRMATSSSCDRAALSPRQGLRRLGHARGVRPARSRSRRVPRDGTDHPADHRIPHLGHRRPADRDAIRPRRSAMRSAAASSTTSCWPIGRARAQEHAARRRWNGAATSGSPTALSPRRS